MSVEKKNKQREFLRECRKFVKEGQSENLAKRAQAVIRENILDDRGVLTIGEILSKNASEGGMRIGLLGQCTTNWISHSIRAVALGAGSHVSVTESPYDSVIQAAEHLSAEVDVIVLLPWSERLLGTESKLRDTVVHAEVEYWNNVWTILQKRRDLRVVQVGYDWVSQGVSGQLHSVEPYGDVGVIRKINFEIKESLPDSFYFLNLEVISSLVGKSLFYDVRNYYWTKDPFTAHGTVRLAENIWSAIRTMISGPKKVLVIDLDNTLWGGVVGELGAHGIDIGESASGLAYRKFQAAIKELKNTGCILAVCSKNNEDDAREPFLVNEDMVLQLEDFALFKASWDSKSDVIREIAQALNIGTDSIVFFDDSKFEQEEVKALVPEVEVVEVPDDPAEFIDALCKHGWFETIGVTNEDKLRSSSYAAESERKKAKNSFGSIGDYFSSLEMQATIDLLGPSGVTRTAQLFSKTNQFNLTTKRKTISEIQSYLNNNDKRCHCLRLKDRFGDYGVVSVVCTEFLILRNRKYMVVESWLMSCRAMSRTVEHFVMNQIIDFANESDSEYIVGNYIETAKNKPVKGLYEDFGFYLEDSLNDLGEGKWYIAEVNKLEKNVSYITQIE